MIVQLGFSNPTNQVHPLNKEQEVTAVRRELRRKNFLFEPMNEAKQHVTLDGQPLGRDLKKNFSVFAKRNKSKYDSLLAEGADYCDKRLVLPSVYITPEEREQKTKISAKT